MYLVVYHVGVTRLTPPIMCLYIAMYDSIRSDIAFRDLQHELLLYKSR
jgi:hypothetical protein